MQINVVEGSTPAVFTAMIFPSFTPETSTWLQEQWSRGTEMLTESGRMFLDSAKAYWDSVYDPYVMQRARAMVRAVNGALHPNMIIEVKDIDGLRKAQPVMQRYLMAEPTIRGLYHQQLCDGYSDSYFDRHPGEVGVNHYDYRRVMTGAVSFVENDDGEQGWTATMYIDDLEEGDRELEADEKFIIRGAWDLIRDAIRDRQDPTDLFKGTLEI